MDAAWSHFVRIMLIALVSLATAAKGADPAPPKSGETLYRERCASCHSEPGVSKVPSLVELREMAADQMFFALSNGVMKKEAAGLSLAEIGAIVGYASAGTRPDYAPGPGVLCANREVALGEPALTRWAFDERGSRAIGSDRTAIDRTNVAELELEWAFGLPGASELRSQPVATSDTLFVAASSGHVFALDRRTGCVKWHRATPVRSSLLLGRLPGRAALFFGDMQGFVTALDAANGEIVWRERAGLFPESMITGGLVQHGDRLFVPISSIEVGIAADPRHECCKTHGAVRAIDAATGVVIWTYETTPPARPTARNSAGRMQWGPSGAPVWSSPTVDAARGLLYVGTGENYSSPPTGRSDAILALDLETGREKWHMQGHEGDAYNNACDSFPPGPNCPKENGPDFDVGASVAIAKDSSGRDLLLAGQKSGDVWALDPDAGGKVVWHRRIGSGSKLGGVHWGISVSEGRVFVPIADPPLPVPGYRPKPGLYALSVDDGSVLWEHPIERGCETDLRSYFQRRSLYPECSFWFGPSSAPTALPGVVIAGALDGELRAFSAADGKVLWRFSTVRPFATVNQVDGHGGSIDASGAVAVGRMLYVQSGYGQFGELPGNVLLAFGLGSTATNDAAERRP